MGKIITIHSYKGGTGKTSVAIGLAHSLALGRKVALIDLDFRGPNIAVAYDLAGKEKWMNDYLNGNCVIEDCLIDVSEKYKLDGQLFIAAADYSTEAIRDMSAKDRKWEMRALGKLLHLRIELLNKSNFDFLIFDTSSGLTYSAINAIVAADIVLVVNTADWTQVKVTRRMITELYNLFEKKTALVINKASKKHQSLTEFEAACVEYERDYDLPILGVIPCFCELLESGLNPSLLQKKPKDLYVGIMSELASRIEAFALNNFVIPKDSELKKIYRDQFIKKVTGLVT